MNYLHLDEVDSTNAYLIRNDLPIWTVLTAGFQSHGRGRSGRVWEQADSNKDLALSIILPPEIEMRKLFGLQIALGYAVVDVLRLSLAVNLKWPNDLMHLNKKLGGILMECVFKGNNLQKIVFGVGINVNAKSYPDTAVSILDVIGYEYDLLELKKNVAESVKSYYSDYCGGVIQIDSLWGSYSAYIGENIKFHRGGSYATYREVGLSKDGFLKVANDEGEIEIVSDGEVGYDFGF